MDKKIEIVITDYEKKTGRKPLSTLPEGIQFVDDICALLRKYVGKYDVNTSEECLKAVFDILSKNGFNEFHC